MNSPMTGTSIRDLQRNESMEQFSDIHRLNDMQMMQYNTMRNMTPEMVHNPAHHNMQAQHNTYYSMENSHDYPQYLPKPQAPVPPMPPMAHMQETQQLPQVQMQQVVLPEETLTEEPDMEGLAIDISNSLPVNAFPVSVSDVPDDSTDVKSGGYLSFIPDMLREPLLLLVLFVILSEGTVKDTISKYISQLNPDFNGRVSRVGVIIYGVILATLFVLGKKLLM